MVFVLGRLAEEIIVGACKDHLKSKLSKLFGWLEKLGRKDDLQVAYAGAMTDAYAVCLEKLLAGMKLMGSSNRDLAEYEESLKSFIGDTDVAGEMLKAVKNPLDETVPSPAVLQDRWAEMECKPLPSDQLWPIVAGGFRSQAREKAFLTPKLRDILNARNHDQAVGLLKRIAGVAVNVRPDKYAVLMRTRYAPVDLANLMPSYADDPGRLVIRDVFVPQTVREDPPPVEVPKDLAEHLREKGGDDLADLDDEQRREVRGRIEKSRANYTSQSPRSVLDVVADSSNRLVTLTGEPGSGKSTLMRYLLLGVLEPLLDGAADERPAWTATFDQAFPLLIELRDFHALRGSGTNATASSTTSTTWARPSSGSLTTTGWTSA